MNKFQSRGIAIITFALLAGCATAPLGPSPGVTAGLGKSDADFQADVKACMAVAADAVKASVKNANNATAMGVAAGMVAGSTTQDAARSGLQQTQDSQAGIQHDYDVAYGGCMFQRGDNVPGMEREVAPPLPPPPPQRVVNPLVQQVQQALIQLGYLQGTADGVPGKKTAAAISKFESDKGMTVDGVASRNLLAALKAASAGGNGGGMAMPPPPASGGMAMPPPPPAN